MTPEKLRSHLEAGAECIFAKRLGENESVRGCYSLTFDRRKGFHAVERSIRQIKRTAVDCGVLFLVFTSGHITALSGVYGEEVVAELPEDDAALTQFLQQLPRYDLTTRVQMQTTLKKIGFFR